VWLASSLRMCNASDARIQARGRWLNPASVSIYWTETQQWFEGTFKTSRIEAADGGGKQRTSCVLYDATGLWARCTQKQLNYWHCLEDEQWTQAETNNE
jgi:hypothetical protein